MPQPWIKICGITRNADALTAVELGADAIGLVFYPGSLRALDHKRAAEITDGLRGRAAVVALFVDPDETEVAAVLDTGCIDMLQFHGAEEAAFCRSFGVPYLKAFRVGGALPVESAIREYESAAMILLDSFDEKAPGGTGKVFDWETGRRIVESTEKNVVIAGGLNPENIQGAVRQTRPFGVDVSSGVEKTRGIKDPEKIHEFINRARSARG